MYFVKVDEGQDLYTQESFIRSNYCKGGQVYLLNAKPGRYAAVAMFTASPGFGFPYTTFLSKKIIKLTEVTVAPGTIEFAGKYVVKSSIGLGDADGAQRHYLQLIAPGARTDLASMAFSAEGYYKGSLREKHCGKQDEIEFLTHALEHFKDTDWTNIFEKRLEELKVEK